MNNPFHIKTTFYAFLLLLISASVAAQQQPTSTINTYADFIFSLNPKGVMAKIGTNYQKTYEIDPEYNVPSNQIKLGGELGINPAFSQLTAYSEWTPASFSTIRIQYNHFNFLGQFGGLLSFPSPYQPFGENIIDSRNDEQVTTVSQIAIKPLLRAKLGEFIIQNEFTLANYRFNGSGSYFLDLENHFLLKDKDTLYINDFSIFKQVDVLNKYDLFIGPFYQWLYAKSSKVSKQRIALNLFLATRQNKQERFYSRIGFNIEDQNRQNEFFILFGYGMDL